MNISYNWLKRYLKTDLSAEEMATILTDIGLEVESFEKIESIRGGLAGVVVGEVLTCTDHPDSDHLHLTTVDVGGEAPLQIVCGAPNCRQGLKVLCATVGAVLYPNGGEEEFKIKRSKIRGVESLGMLCAEDELGIGASHEGIMELPADAKVGQPAWEYLKLEDDYVIGIGLTPNRIDAASHIGVARDLAAYLKSQGKPVELQWPDVSAFAVDNHDLKIDVQVENSEAAPRYAGVTVKNCKIGPSPEWMQNCLRTAGITPKNNLVDITNFVLFELGQPLHAFDAAKFDGGRIVVRTCEEGTPFITLDGVERKLTANDLMICSAERPMCIAGVFGGLDSGISDTTTDVFIESAYFNPVWVRKTAKRFGLNTDSSFRFERGIDPNMQVYAAKRAALLQNGRLHGGQVGKIAPGLGTEDALVPVIPAPGLVAERLLAADDGVQPVLLAAAQDRVAQEHRGVAAVVQRDARAEAEGDAPLRERQSLARPAQRFGLRARGSRHGDACASRQIFQQRPQQRGDLLRGLAAEIKQLRAGRRQHLLIVCPERSLIHGGQRPRLAETAYGVGLTAAHLPQQLRLAVFGLVVERAFDRVEQLLPLLHGDLRHKDAVLRPRAQQKLRRQLQQAGKHRLARVAVLQTVGKQARQLDLAFFSHERPDGRAAEREHGRSDDAEADREGARPRRHHRGGAAVRRPDPDGSRQDHHRQAGKRRDQPDSHHAGIRRDGVLHLRKSGLHRRGRGQREYV